MYLLKPTALLVMFALTLSFNACKDDEPEVVQDQFEPNNSIVAASNTTLGTDVIGGIAEAADVDFYKITGAGTTKIDQLRFSLSNASDANFSLVIYNKDKVEIAQVPAGGKSANLSYFLETAESEFYVKVVGTDASVYPANYTLNVSFLNTADEFEGNDIIGSAAAFPLSLVKDCNLLTNDIDFYQIQDLSSENVWDEYEIKLINKTADMNPSIEVYDASKSIIADYTTTNAGGGLDITKAILMRSGESNSQYIKVFSNSTISTTPAGYTLQVVKKNTNESSEPNDTYATAKQITAEGQYSGVAIMKTSAGPSKADYDVYLLIVPTGSSCNLYVKSASGDNSKVSYDMSYTYTSSTTSPSIYISNRAASSTSSWIMSNTSGNTQYTYFKIYGNVDKAGYILDYIIN